MNRRKFVRLERALLRYRPSGGPPARPAPPKPFDADAVMASLALFCRPGDRVGIREIADIAGVTLGKAGSVRTWAKAAGIWPYLDEVPGIASAAGRGKAAREAGGET